MLHKTPFSRSALAIAAISGALLATSAWAQVKVGVLATLEGPFASPGQDSVRGVQLALDDVKSSAGGKSSVSP